MHKQESIQENKTNEILEFWDINNFPNPFQKTRPNAN